jgi:hypothetical protein
MVKCNLSNGQVTLDTPKAIYYTLAITQVVTILCYEVIT